jgi:hypothetical protein
MTPLEVACDHLGTGKVRTTPVYELVDTSNATFGFPPIQLRFRRDDRRPISRLTYSDCVVVVEVTNHVTAEATQA